MTAMGSAKLNNIFFRFNSKDVSVEKFMFNLKNMPLGVKNKDTNIVAYTLKKRIDSYIEEDLLADESLKRGLDKKPEFQQEISKWKENYVSHMLRNEYLKKDSVSDAEVYQYYLSLTNKVDTIPSVNMLEILTDKLEIVELVLNELNKGTDFRELAKKYTIRKWAKEKGGELGLLPINVNKELSINCG